MRADRNPTESRPELIDVDGREVRIIESYDDAGAVYTPMPLPGLPVMGTEAIQVPAGLGFEETNRWAELTLWAERKAGELLADSLNHNGGRPAKNCDSESRFRLEDIGVSRKQSSRWQAIARVPEREFAGHLEAWLAERDAEAE